MCAMQKKEELLHALRDCPYAKIVWRKLVSKEKRYNFFTATWKDWLTINFCSKGRREDELRWPKIFVTGCWMLWKWRNQQLHDQNFKVPWPADELIRQYVYNCS